MAVEKWGFEFEPATNELGVTIGNIERDTKELCSDLETLCEVQGALRKGFSLILDLLLKSSSDTKAIGTFKEVANESQQLLESFSNLLHRLSIKAKLIHADALIAVARQMEEWLELNYGVIQNDEDEDSDDVLDD